MKSDMAGAGRAVVPIEANPRLRETSTGLVDYGAIPESRRGQETSMHRVLIVGGGAGGTRTRDAAGGSSRQTGQSVDIASRQDPRARVEAAFARDRFGHSRYRSRFGRVSRSCAIAPLSIPCRCDVRLDREKRQVFVEPTLDEDARQLIPPRVLGYDTLIVAVGSVGNDFATPGVKEHAIAIDSADEAARFNRRLINACVRANAQYEPLHEGQLHCVIIGAGATGVELVAELHKTMRDIAAFGLDNIDFDKLIRLTIIEAGPRILGPLPQQLATSTQDMLNQLGVQVLTCKQAAEITKDGVRLASGEFIPAEIVVWAAGIKAPEFLKDIDELETDRINRLVVRDTLQTTRDDNIFAIGDCACFVLPDEGKPTPPRAQTAHQMASLVEKAVSARLKKEALPKFKYRDFGNLVNLAEYGTVGNLAGFVGKRSVYLEGVFARLMYRSLYKMHQRALHGTLKTALDTAASLISRRTEPRVKLH